MASDPFFDGGAWTAERLTRLRSPLRSAGTPWIEEIIDPREMLRPGPATRPMRP
jgi:hypothetical protein